MLEGAGIVVPDGFSEPVGFTRGAAEAAPDAPGVHVLWDAAGAALYVGETRRLRERMLDHLRDNRRGSILHNKVGRLLDTDLGHTASQTEILDFLASCRIAWQLSDDPKALKASLMDSLQPTFNEIRPTKPSGASGDLRDVIERTLETLQDREAPGALDRYRHLITGEFPALMRAVVPEGHEVVGRIGMGPAADVPWVGVFPPGGHSAKSGVYLVYLFAFDGKSVYLSLNQGAENVRGGTNALQKRVLDIRDSLGGVGSGYVLDIDLRSENTRPKRYEAGSAYALEYRAGVVPDSATLRADLDGFLEMLRETTDSSLEFRPDLEPTHLVMKWSEEIKPGTVGAHRAVADTKGAVWWGKFAASGGRTAMSAARIEGLRTQLNEGVETHVYLYRRGEAWRTRLRSITADPSEVDVERLPSYYTTDDCNLFLLLDRFERLDDPDWPSTHLLLATNPDPTAVPGALANQTSPLLVFERFDAQDGPAPSPPSTLTLEWLESKTLWTRESLDELVDALKDRPQIVLAGPPGTGKTWVAEHLARYLTNDEPLASRVLQFHPSYGYEEFIEGLRPVAVGSTFEFRRQDGAVLQMVDRMEDTSGGPHVLILDEMNRANLPRVFGELMYALEYREQPVSLMYSEDFELPANLLFIGTMNTADRSIRSIDVALRRRFEVFECFPDVGILERFYTSHVNEVPDLLPGFIALNTHLEDQLDRHHTIGHSFFMADPMTATRMRNTWRRQLAPLLEEYFFDQPDVATSFSVEAFWPSLTYGTPD